jgi:RNA polymerase sigma-70 factor (ECF subfamily)
MESSDSNISEHELIARCQAGDKDAFAVLVRQHQARLRALVSRYLSNLDDVYDVVQETFIKAYTHMASFERGREFGPWLRSICRNHMVSFLRERGAHRMQHLSDIDNEIIARAETCDMDGKTDAGDEISALKECLGALQSSHRLLMDLRYHQNVPVKDISSQFGKSEASVSMMLMRLRDALLRCMRKQMPLEET